MKEILKKHKVDTQEKFTNYKFLKENAGIDESKSKLYLIFGFSKKVILPRLLREPGQLHFVTGLKVEFFGVHVGNLKTTAIDFLV